jgi:hypothetical protein
MQRWRQIWGGALLFGATLALAVALLGCGDDLYASCSLESGTNCADREDDVSCVEEQNVQCETQVCARYKGSKPYCTTTCSSDGDCTGGKCRQFPFGSQSSYCVEDTDV